MLFRRLVQTYLPGLSGGILRDIQRSLELVMGRKRRGNWSKCVIWLPPEHHEWIRNEADRHGVSAYVRKLLAIHISETEEFRYPKPYDVFVVMDDDEGESPKRGYARVTEEEVDYWVALYNKGTTYEKIAEIANRSKTTIYRHLKDHPSVDRSEIARNARFKSIHIPTTHGKPFGCL